MKVELELGSRPGEAKVILDGVDVTGALQELEVEAGVNQLPVLRLRMFSQVSGKLDAVVTRMLRSPVDSRGHVVWRPWERYKNAGGPIPVYEPPCRECKHFDPVSYSGKVSICQTPGDMEKDFSCFRQENIDEPAGHQG